MNLRNEAIRLARTAGAYEAARIDGAQDSVLVLSGNAAIEQFAGLVAEAERERCANACEGFRHGLDSRSSQAEGWAAAQCAEAIRALKP